MEFYRELATDFIRELTPHGMFFIGASVIIFILMSVTLWIDSLPLDKESKAVDFLGRILKADGKLRRNPDRDITKIMSKLFEYCNSGNIKKIKKI